jgi:hypothetical protein
MDERKISKGLGAVAAGGWSVATVNEPKWASTREPPGKSIIISMSSSPMRKELDLSRYYFSDEQTPKKIHMAQEIRLSFDHPFPFIHHVRNLTISFFQTRDW